MGRLLVVVFIVFASRVRLGSSINIDGSCPVDLYRCLQCLSRGSSDLERCQQLFFFVTYTNMSNEAQISQYCTGDCPILLATAQYYCGVSSRIQPLFQVCPGYSVEPSGSFNVNANYSKQHCLDTNLNRRCSHCIGESTREAVRCLQMYLLAQYSNNTASYVQTYCSSNCPVTMWSSSWYCNLQTDQRRAYDICQRQGATSCLEVQQQSPTAFNSAIMDCRTNCISDDCTSARKRYGCCLRRDSTVASRCSDIPECPIDALGGTQNINFDGKCPFNALGCLQCLSRNSATLERCEQLYSVITTTASHDSEEVEFCAGQCPSLLISSRYFCGTSSSSTLRGIMNSCPSYDVMPSTSIDIRANYSGQNCFNIFTVSGCSECILSRSSDLTRCYRLYFLSLYANMSQVYSKAFCTSNCPARMATLQWYCNGMSAEDIYSNCVRRDQNTYCGPLIRDSNSEIRGMATACTSNCTNALCKTGKEMFGCCLRQYLSDSICPEIPSCILGTLAGSPGLLAAVIITFAASALPFLINF